MTTKTNSVTFGDISTQVSNKDAEGRKFNINGNAKINDGKFVGLDGGNFTKVDGNGNGWFSFNQSNSFSFNCNGFNATEIEEAIKAVMDFYEEVKEAVNAKNA